MRALAAAIPCDWVSLNEIGPPPEATIVLVEPALDARLSERYVEFAHENPLVVRYAATRDGRAYRFSDVCSVAELHATELYRSFYAVIGLEHQMAFTLPQTPERFIGVALSRRDRDFSDYERDLVDRARPFLIQAYRNAAQHSRLVTELELREHGERLPLDDPWLRQALASRGISEREAEILSCVSSGLSDEQVGDSVGLSRRTVQKHLQRCYAKLGVHSRADAIAAAWAMAGEPAAVSARARTSVR